jgi:hypothetical protein
MEKHFHHWAVEMTFLTPPLNFDQSGHTQPSPRHHGSIYVDRFGYDAASSGEMNHLVADTYLDLSLRATTFEPNVARNKFPYFLPKKGSRFKSQRAVVAMTMATPRLCYRVYYRPVAGATVENLILIPSQSALCV